MTRRTPAAGLTAPLPAAVRLPAAVLLLAVALAGSAAPGSAAPAADDPRSAPAAGSADPRTAPPDRLADPHAAVPADAAGLRRLLAGAGLAVAPLDSLSFVLKDTTTGVQMIVFVEDAGASLQAVLPYRGPGTVPLATLQQWNATRRFGRAYADRRGAPVLATDLALGPGVGQAAVVAWAELALALGDRFRQEAWPRPGPPPEPARE
jgi:hypothetical protein